jgi:formamidopyrimidine-DNA glycosylase
MPELPEVERARALLERAALGRRITAVDDCDEWVCRPHRPGEIAGALEGATLVSAHRRGKAMWVETDREAVLGLHLGMAGRIVVDDAAEGDPPDGAETRDDGAPAAHPRGWDRFTLTFADGGRLALRDKRRLGRVRLDPRPKTSSTACAERCAPPRATPSAAAACTPARSSPSAAAARPARAAAHRWNAPRSGGGPRGGARMSSECDVACGLREAISANARDACARAPRGAPRRGGSA